MALINLADFEHSASEKMSASAWAYYRSGANDESTLQANRSAYARLCLHYRTLVDVSQRSMATTVLGHDIAMPVMIAPTAFQQLADPAGELATAAAAGRAGTVMILSTLSTMPVEDVLEAASGPVWFQLYVYRDRDATRALVERVQAAGCQALVLTVDAPVLGRREADVRGGFHLPEGLRAANLLGRGQSLERRPGESGLAAYFGEQLDPGLSWADVRWLRSITDLPLVIKGLCRPDDAARAVDCGAAAIVVSNHGGRQLDGAPATIDVVEEVATAVHGRAEIYLDGGIRRGSDVIKALALGADAVLLGRPVLWGLAVDGQVGVERVLKLLADEIDLALALCGCPTLSDIPRDLVRPVARS